MKYGIWHIPQNIPLSVYQLNHGLGLAFLKAFNLVSHPAADCELSADMCERRLYNFDYWGIGARFYEYR
jgi:hypothetical protein